MRDSPELGAVDATSQSDRMTRLMLAASMIKDGGLTGQTLDLLLTHGIAMLGGMACDLEAIRVATDKLVCLSAHRAETALLMGQSSGALSLEVCNGKLAELCGIVGELKDGRDHSGTAGDRQDDADGGTGGGGAGPRNPA